MGEGGSGLESQMRWEVALPGNGVPGGHDYQRQQAQRLEVRELQRATGVLRRPVTKGVASTLSLVVTDTNSNDVSVVWSGIRAGAGCAGLRGSSRSVSGADPSRHEPGPFARLRAAAAP